MEDNEREKEEALVFQKNVILMQAVLHDEYEEMIPMIISTGANVNHLGDGDKTPLMEAVCRNKKHLVKLLLDFGADPEIVSTDESKLTALHMAAKNDFVDIAKLLLDAGAKVDSSIVFEDDVPGKWTPLHGACIHASKEMIGLLLDHGADIESKQTNENTPLSLAARNYRIGPTRYLVQRGADVNAQDNYGATPLIHAALIGATEIAKILVEEGNADMNIKTQAGETALDEASNNDMWECATYLWRAGCNSGSFKKTKGLGPVNWIRPRIIGDAPSARYTCGAVGIGSCMYILGGTGRARDLDKHFNPDSDFKLENSYPARYNDFFVLDVDKLSHKSIIPTNTTKAPANNTLNREEIGPHLHVSHDGLVLTSTDPDYEDAESTCAKANFPFTRDYGLGYFEVLFTNAGTRGILAVGLVDEEYALDRMPGWESESFGYHGDDACVFHNIGHGRTWGKRFGTGDVVGCGILFETNEVFFTLNGEFLGVAYKCAVGDMYYPAVGFRTAKAQAKFNFGMNPFLFDFRVPTLSWKQLPTARSIIADNGPYDLFSIDGSVVALAGASVTRTKRLYWVFDRNGWNVHIADGKPLIFEPFKLVQIDRSIYCMVSNPDDGSRRSSRPLPMIWKLTFEEGDLSRSEWTQIFPKSTYLIPNEYEKNWFKAEELIRKDYGEALLVAAEGKLCLIGSTSMALLDPVTFEIQEKIYVGAIPPVERFSAISIGSEIETFGGWDNHHQRNQVNMLDTTEAIWYQPQVTGVNPRPRNNNSVATVRVSNPKALRIAHNLTHEDQMQSSLATADSMVTKSSDSTSPDTQSKDISNLLIMHAFGWNGVNFSDDLEILSLQNKEAKDELHTLIIEGNTQTIPPGYVTFQINRDGKTISAPSIIIAARASGFRETLVQHNTTTISIDDAPYDLFLAFIGYLHDDCTDFSIDTTDATSLCQIFDKYAPEHSQRIIEALVLTRMYSRSSMSKDLLWAFKTPYQSDLELEVEGQIISAHKCILISRCPYFRNLLTGGLLESGASRISVPDCSFIPFTFLLSFIYTQLVDTENIGEHIIDVFILASKFSVTKLKSQLESVIAYNLSIENVTSLLILANQHAAKLLEKECCKFIQYNEAQVAASADFLDHIEIVSPIIELYNQAKRESAERKLAQKWMDKFDQMMEEEKDGDECEEQEEQGEEEADEYEEEEEHWEEEADEYEEYWDEGEDEEGEEDYDDNEQDEEEHNL